MFGAITVCACDIHYENVITWCVSVAAQWMERCEDTTYDLES